MNAGVKFATLDNVALREAWAHEAHSFTPWLAENLERISEAIGVPLELVGTEVAVGRYAADILAKNARDDSYVLIENQLEHGDHGHLGQILTYLTGLRASTVIWVAADFQAEHLSAINWLNQNTIDPYAFFAVRLRVVRIGSSPYAPLFEVVERPNDWDRTVQEAARSSADLTDLGLFRRGFWECYLTRHPEPGGRATADAGRWIQVPGTELVVAQYMAKDRVGVYVRGQRSGDAEAVRTLLSDHEAALTERLGARLGGRGTPYFLDDLALRIDTRDRSNWDRMADWLANEAQRFVGVLTDVLGGTR